MNTRHTKGKAMSELDVNNYFLRPFKTSIKLPGLSSMCASVVCLNELRTVFHQKSPYLISLVISITERGCFGLTLELGNGNIFPFSSYTVCFSLIQRSIWLHCSKCCILLLLLQNYSKINPAAGFHFSNYKMQPNIP